MFLNFRFVGGEFFFEHNRGVGGDTTDDTHLQKSFDNFWVASVEKKRTDQFVLVFAFRHFDDSNYNIPSSERQLA